MRDHTAFEWDEILREVQVDAWLVDMRAKSVIQVGHHRNVLKQSIESGASVLVYFNEKILQDIKHDLARKCFYSNDIELPAFKWFGNVSVTKLSRHISLFTFSDAKYLDKNAAHKNDALEKHRQRADLAEELNAILRQEIHHHKQTQEKLLRTEKYAKSIIDSSLNIILAVDNEGIIKESNRNIESVLGLSKSEMLYFDIREFLKDKKDFGRIVSFLEKQNFFRDELSFLTKHGSEKKLFVSVSALNGDKGDILGTLWSMKDLTEEKHSKEILATTAADYEDLFENASDLIQGLTSDGRLIYANKAWKSRLGYSDEEIRDLCFYNVVDEADRIEYKNYLEGILKGKKLKTKVWRLVSRTGDCILVESNDNLKIQSGQQPTIRSIMRDVTESVAADKRAKEEQAKINAIFNSGEHMFWTVNENTALTSFNEKYKECIFQIYGEYPEINKDKNKPKRKFASEEYHNFWTSKYLEVFNTGKSVYFQTRTITKEGKEQFREVFLNPIFDTDDEHKVNEVAGMAIDISDKKLAERMLNEQSKKIKTIFNAAQHMIWSVDCEMNLTSFNDYFVKKHNERFGIEIIAGLKINDLYKRRNAMAREALVAQYERALKGEKIQFELGFYDHRGKLHTEEIFLSPIYNDEGIVSEIAGISQTVTFKRTAERKLKDQAAKINAIFDSTAMLIWTVDKKMRMVSYNKVFANQHFKLLGKEVSIGDELTKSLKGSVQDEGLSELKGYFAEAFKGNKQQFEGVLYGVDGKKRWMETFLNPIYLEDDNVKEISCLSYEITDKKHIEEQMLESIREKEILLQEVHHRVKNNLQVISSILNLQSAYVKDQNSLDILRESQNRIKSMSFIHESLYQTRDFSQIEFSDYILSLTNNLIHSYSIKAGKITLETDFRKVFLSLDQAIPCGLIINELVSNALKYAYPNHDKGVIKLVIREENGKVEIKVGDNGVGLPKGLDVENSESLGLQLVYTLIDQLDASIKIDSKKGTEYLITFDKL